MKIVFAETYGFCYGVKRSMELANSQANRQEAVCTYGPLIHNDQVIEKLESIGIQRKESIQEILEDFDTVIIRSHGIPEADYRQFEKRGLEIIDATCPFVKKIHHSVQACYQNDRPVIIIGDAKHKEVIGINGWCGNQGWIIDQADQIDSLPEMESPCVVAQTTFSLKRFNDMMGLLQERYPDLRAYKTICAATEKAAKRLRRAGKVG